MKTYNGHHALRARRGSTILLAVGVLATLAIVALIYLSNVSSERSSAVRVAQGAPYERASERVRDEIGALLAADLFGNKITTNETPQYQDPSNFQTRIWPRMFEDGEYSDYPFVESEPNSPTYTFNLNRPWQASPSSRAVLDPTGAGGATPSTAPSRDDAWLSTTEPFFIRNSPEDSYWPQISNLRDGYRWRSDLTQWVRSDGRFADLGQWFLTNRALSSGRGDSEADLSPDSITDFGFTISAQPNTPTRGLSQRVFGYQINSMRELADGDGSFGSLAQADPNNGPRPLDLADERFWADTDGDLRPDARWQTLESLDGLFGLKWVAAARITDNSALINVNTALDSGGEDSALPFRPAGAAPGVYMADGRTPSDVDLFRLLFLANDGPNQDALAPSGAWLDIAITGFSRNGAEPSFFDIATLPGGAPPFFPYRSAFREHMDRGLGLTSLINHAYERSGGGQIPYGVGSEMLWRLSREERAVSYRTLLAHRGAGASAGDAGRVYPISDEADLRTFWASNDDRSLSGLEQRLDYGYLPGQQSTLTNPTDLRGVIGGPLRAARPTSLERTLQQIERPNGSLRGRPTVQEVEDDVRHLLTTYNGASDVSPIPVLNPAIITTPGPMQGRPVYEGRYANRKIRIADFPRGNVVVPGAAFDRKADLIRRSFGAFTWALAPMATNEPLMAGLTTADIAASRPVTSTPQNKGHDYHYGGGSQANGGIIGSPASEFGRVAGAIGGPTAEDLGASYAVLRAASLAVNLADATDNAEDPLPTPNTPTRETPTVVRLFNIPEIDPSRPHNSNSPLNLTALQPIFDAGVIPMGVRFSHGDIADPGNPIPTSDTLRLPARFVGRPQDGVTLIGLDRQPFLMEAWTLAYYDAGVGAPGASIDPFDPARQLGSIVAVEVGNPWPEPLNLAGFHVRIQTPTGFIRMELAGVIDVGKSLVVWGTSDRGGSSEWTSVLTQWRNGAQGRLGTSAELATTGASLTLTEYGNPTPVQSPVIFQVIGQAVGAQTSVGVVTLWTQASGVEAMVDRIWKRLENTTAFPATFRGIVNLPEPPPIPQSPTGTIEPSEWSGRIVAVSSLRRPTEPSSATGTADAGFPAWVIENAHDNVVRMKPDNAGGAGTAEWYQSWWTDLPSPVVPAAEELIRPIAIGYPVADDLQDKLGQPKEAFNHFTSNRALPAYQLFVPNRPPQRGPGNTPSAAEQEEWNRLGSLAATSELHMLCTFAHMYVHGAADPDPGTQIAQAAVLTAMPEFFGMADPGSGGFWRTVSEQLGDRMELEYATGGGVVVQTPYLGTLDPSRFTLRRTGSTAQTGMGQLPNLPDAMAVPLAIRVFDAFEVLDLQSDLAQGRMNINTAPLKAIRMLPFVSPWHPVGVPNHAESLADASSGGASSPMAQLTDRGSLIVDYRDGIGDFGGNNGAFDRAAKLVHPGLRVVGDPPATGGGAAPVSLGFHHVGELTLLAQWHGGSLTGPLNAAVGDFTAGVPYANFAELARLGGVAQNAGVTTSVTAPGVADVDSVLDVRENGSGGDSDRVYDPIDDAEERLAIFRAISNIATTRSDVFTAWFVVRAYDPKRIDAIEVPAGANQSERARLLNQLEPTHESRWLAVFDRSNVRLPTDRPRVLLFTRLPK